MRALIAQDYGPPAQLALGQAPQPEPGAGQVLVQIRAAALNPFDLKLLTGAFKGGVPVAFPYVPGMDGAGTVAALGEGVRGVAVGDEVFGFFGRSPGTIAEFAVLDAGDYLAPRPPGLDPVHAAALPESGITAKTLLRAVGIGGDAQGAAAGSQGVAAGIQGVAAGGGDPPGSLLVVGATGGIGMFVVQLAAAAGVEVLATAGPAETGYVLGLGAAHALDYTSEDPAQLALAVHPQGVDGVIDLVNGGDGVRGSAVALRDGGRLASPLGGPEDLGRGIQSSYVSLTLLGGDLEDLGVRAASGALRVEVSRVYPFAEAVQAFVDFAEGHTRGKLVVDLGA